MITNAARCTREIEQRTAKAKAAFNRKKILLTSKLEFNLRMKLVKYYTYSTVFYGADTWTLWKVDQK
jgi:hypothetical protein